MQAQPWRSLKKSQMHLVSMIYMEMFGSGQPIGMDVPTPNLVERGVLPLHQTVSSGEGVGPTIQTTRVFQNEPIPIPLVHAATTSVFDFAYSPHNI